MPLVAKNRISIIVFNNKRSRGNMSEESTPKAIGNLQVGMALEGTVKRIEIYGAFVDVGVGQDGLLHVSQLGKSDVKSVGDVLKVGEKLTVYIYKIENGRIALTLVAQPTMSWDSIGEGQMLTGKVVRIENFGVFVDIGAERPGMVHVSELADGYVKNPSDVVKVDQEVQVRVLKINRKKRQIDLSMKTQSEAYEAAPDEKDDESFTSMEMAFRKAMGKDENSANNRNARNRRDTRKSQEDIIARTLREHSNTK